MHVKLRRLYTIAMLLSIFLPPLMASHTYFSEPAADFTNTSLVSTKIGVLVGTLVLDPDYPINKITYSPTISSSQVQMYYTNQNQLKTTNLSGTLYVTYFKKNGSKVGTELTTQASLTFNNLNMNMPITFHILVKSSDYTTFINTVRGFIFQSQNKFVGMGVNGAFNLVSSSNITYPVISNQGETTSATPFVGGGIPGPAGDKTIAIGDPGVSSSWLYPYNISDKPIYSLSFTNNNVFIQNIEQALNPPLPLTNMVLDVENYQNTYLGESQVTVRFYQTGYPSFRFLLETDSACQLPYTLWINNGQVPYDIPFSPWPAPLGPSNSAQISLKILQQDLSAALAGSYTTTITVEILSGI